MITFDPVNKRIILDTSTVSAVEIYSRSVDWLSIDDNMKYGLIIRQVGSDDLGGGLSIPPYFFLQGDWRVRPMEQDHTLTLDGNLFVDGGGDPVVQTVGNYNVLVKSVVPVQAQGISTSGTQPVEENSIKKNTAFNNFTFILNSKTDNITPIEGENVTALKSIDGGAFIACTNQVIEIGSGVYKINLSASDLNGNTITLKFSSTNAVKRFITIIPS